MTITPPPETRLALKEWSGITAALRSGRQSILLRAGGIEDPSPLVPSPGDWFWIFPTITHQEAQGLREPVATGQDLLAPESHASQLNLDLVATITDHAWIDDIALVHKLESLHIWTRETVEQRFRYRRPGLWVMLPRVWRRASPHALVDPQAYAGCRSWVQLAAPLELGAIAPVLDEPHFERVRTQVTDLLRQSG